jgi:hypothetical protein
MKIKWQQLFTEEWWQHLRLVAGGWRRRWLNNVLVRYHYGLSLLMVMGVLLGVMWLWWWVIFGQVELVQESEQQVSFDIDRVDRLELWLEERAHKREFGLQGLQRNVFIDN